MRKFLLRSAMLLSGLACVLPASAAKRYVQVSSSHHFVDGANYAVGAVNAHASAQANFPRFYDVTEVTTNDVTSTVVTQTVFKETTAFPSSMIFTLHQIPDLECACTDAGHNDPSHIFVMSQGELTVINNGNSATLATTAEATYPTTAYIHFLPYSSTYFPNETLFAVMFNYNAANRTFAASRAMGTGGFNTFTSRGTVQFFDNNASWSSVTRVYLEVDENDLLPAAKALMEGSVYEEAAKWTAHFQDRTYAEALKTALVEAAMAEVSVDAYTKTYANLEAETEAYVKPIVQSKVPEVLNEWLDGRIVKLQNQGSMHYMTGHPTESINLGTCEEITAASSWGLKKKNDGWIIKNYDQHFVTGSESLGVTYDENAAVVVNIVANDDYTVSLALASDATKLLRAAGNDAIRAAEWSTTDDAYSHWKFYGINYTVQFAARQTEKERIAALVEVYNTRGMLLSEEYDEVKAIIDAIDCTEPESNQEKVTKLEEVSIALANVVPDMWRSLNNAYISLWFPRKNAIVAVNDAMDKVVAPNGVASIKSIWQLQYVNEDKFRLYNPATQRWLAYGSGDYTAQPVAVTTAAAAEQFKFTPYSATDVTNSMTLEGTSVTSYKFFHKVNSDAGTLMRYNNGDAGSALTVVRTSMQLFEKMTVPTSVCGTLLPNTDTNFRNALGDARKCIPEDSEIRTQLASQIADGSEYEDFESAVNVLNVIPTEFGGAFITLTPYPDNTNHLKLHYTDKKATVGTNTFAVLGLLTTDTAPDGYEDDTTEANSIWFYKDGKLVNYDNGYYIARGKNGIGDRFLGFCISPDDNAGAAIKMVNGVNTGASQMIVGGDCGVHIHKSGTYVIANRCSKTGVTNENEHDLNVALVSELPVEIHSDGWGSFYSPITYSIPAGTGCTFFAATYADESLSVYELAAGTKLAAGTAVLISGTAGQTVRMPLNYCEEGDDRYNGFDGAHVAAPHTVAEGMLTYAKTAPAAAESGISTLSIDANEVINLSRVTEAKPVHTMTITVPESTTGISADKTTYAFPIGALTSGIREIVVNRLDGTRTVYDLQGRRLSEPVKGIINIIDGKKILVK